MCTQSFCREREQHQGCLPLHFWKEDKPEEKRVWVLFPCNLRVRSCDSFRVSLFIIGVSWQQTNRFEAVRLEINGKKSGLFNF